MSRHHPSRRDHVPGQQHSFWAGALGWLVIGSAAGVASNALATQGDTPNQAAAKAAAPFVATAAASYWAMRRYPKYHSFFLGGAVEGAIGAPAAAMIAAMMKEPMSATAPTVSLAAPAPKPQAQVLVEKILLGHWK